MSALTKEQIAALPALVARLGSNDGFEAWDACDSIRDIALPIAATAIEQRAEIERLREALAPIADLAEAYDPEDGDDDQHCWVTEFTPKLRDLRRARAALAVKP